VTFFFEFQDKTDTAGDKTREKYRVLLGDPIDPDKGSIPTTTDGYNLGVS
jgi:hypothetical protein